MSRPTAFVVLAALILSTGCATVPSGIIDTFVQPQAAPQVPTTTETAQCGDPNVGGGAVVPCAVAEIAAAIVGAPSPRTIVNPRTSPNAGRRPTPPRRQRH